MKAGDAERDLDAYNVDLVEARQPAAQIDQNLGWHHDQKTACGAALARAEATRDRAIEIFPGGGD
jgi:hypothetical protein